MATLELKGRITEGGKLEVDLPAGIPPGEVTVRIDLPAEPAIDESYPPRFNSNAEVVAWLEANPPIEFVDPEITDPVEWVDARRRKEQGRLKPYWDGEK